MELVNKKINFLGDSITEGAGASKPENMYVNVFAKLANADVTNYGVSGTRIAKQYDPSKSCCESFNEYFVLRAAKMRKDADIIVVFGGTNDFGHGDAPFGEYGSKDNGNFCGTLYNLYKYLEEEFPSAKKVVLTPMHRNSEKVTVNEIGIPCHQLVDYVNVIKNTAKEFSFPVLDLFSDEVLDTNKEENNKKYFFDGLHPSDLGHKLLAEKIYNFLQSL